MLSMREAFALRGDTAVGLLDVSTKGAIDSSKESLRAC